MNATRMTRSAVTPKGIIVAALLLVIAFASAYAFTVSNAAGAPGFVQQALPRSEFYDQLGSRFAPTAARPQRTAAQALEGYRADPIPPNLEEQSPTPPVIRLTSFTHARVGVASPRLAWLIRFDSVPVWESGPSSRVRETVVDRCPFYVVVDATTGQRLESFQTCAPPNRPLPKLQRPVAGPASRTG